MPSSAWASTFSHWVLQEQREEVSSMSALLSVVERTSESNILLAEDHLSRNPVGDQGKAAPTRHLRRVARFNTR